MLADPHADMLDGVMTVQDILGQNRMQLHIPRSVHGALVTDVDANSNSAEAGLKEGDVIIEVNKQLVNNASEAVRLCRDTKDAQILVKIWRRSNNYVGTRYLSVDNTEHETGQITQLRNAFLPACGFDKWPQAGKFIGDSCSIQKD